MFSDDDVSAKSDAAAPTGFKGTYFAAASELPDWLPTRPDAEVQVLEPIAPELIVEAWVDRARAAAEVQLQLQRLGGSDRPVHLAPFEPRYRSRYSVWG